MTQMKLKSETLVMFRTDVRGHFKGDVTAVFPLEPATVGKPWEMTCYAHIGQTGACTPEWMVKETRPATPSEYAPLLKELESLGHDDLRIIKRTPRNAYKVRKANLEAIR
jgi:hypothetical protein